MKKGGEKNAPGKPPALENMLISEIFSFSRQIWWGLPEKQRTS